MSVDDLPRETAERTQQLARVEELERLLRVKDAMLWSMLNDGRAKEAAQVTLTLTPNPNPNPNPHADAKAPS